MCKKSIFSILIRIINSEDKTNPFTDDQLVEELKKVIEHNIAKRTVAKYRNKMGILPSRQRKEK